MLQDTSGIQGQVVRLRALATDAAGKLDVLGEDGDALGVDGAEVGVLEETDEVRLSSFLKRQDGVALEAEIGLRHTGLCVGFRFCQRRFTRTRVKQSRRHERHAGEGGCQLFRHRGSP